MSGPQTVTGLLTQESGFFDPAKLCAGGAGPIVRNHIRGINDTQGWQASLVTPDPKQFGGIEEKFRAHFYDLARLLQGAGVTFNDENNASMDALHAAHSSPAFLEIMEGVLRGHGKDTALYANFFTSRAAALAAIDSGVPVLYCHLSPYSRVRSAYDPSILYGKSNGKVSTVRQEAELQLLKRATGLMFYTRSEAIETANKYPEVPDILDRSHIVPLGVDLSAFSTSLRSKHRKDMRNQFSIPQDALVVGTQSRVCPPKDQLTFADLCLDKGLFKDFPDLYFVVVGSPARGEEGYMAQLKERAAASNGRIVVTGALHPTCGHPMFDVFRAGGFETWGMSIGESKKVGNAIVMQENPIHREIWDLNSGAVSFKPGKPDEELKVWQKVLNRRDWIEHAQRVNPDQNLPTWKESVDMLMKAIQGVVSAST